MLDSVIGSSWRSPSKPVLPGVAALSLVLLVLLRLPSPAASPAGHVVWPLDNVSRIGGYATVLIGAPRVVRTPVGAAVEFNGSTDGLVLDVNPIEGAAHFTVEVVFEPAADGPDEQRFLHISQHGSDRRLMMETRMLPDRSWCLDTYLRMDAPGLTLIDREKAHPGAAWHVAALTYDGKTMTSYVNGERELAGDVLFAPMKAGRVSIGVRQNLVSWFKGRIRLVRITHRALPARDLLPRPAVSVF